MVEGDWGSHTWAGSSTGSSPRQPKGPNSQSPGGPQPRLASLCPPKRLLCHEKERRGNGHGDLLRSLGGTDRQVEMESQGGGEPVMRYMTTSLQSKTAQPTARLFSESVERGLRPLYGFESFCYAKNFLCASWSFILQSMGEWSLESLRVPTPRLPSQPCHGRDGASGDLSVTFGDSKELTQGSDLGRLDFKEADSDSCGQAFWVLNLQQVKS